MPREPVRSRREVGGRDLLLAIASGVVLAGAFIGSVIWHPIAFTVVIGLLASIAMVESTQVLAEEGRHASLPILLVTVLITLVGTYRAGAEGQLVGVTVLFIGAVAWELADHHREAVVDRVGLTLLLGIWMPIVASYGVLLITRPTDGAVAVLAIIGAAIFTDIGGFAFGVKLGRHRIAPAISPAKTWEGLAGGLFLAGGLGALILPRIGDLFDVPTAVAVTLAAGVASFFGDLIESMFKRSLGIKDLGTVIPGHGGILDRVDGILLAMPVGHYVLELLA